MALPRGALRTARRGGRGLRAAAALAPRRPRQAAPVLLVALARLLLQIPADGLLLVLARLVSAVQTVLGLEPPGRPLTAGERELLRRVFGASIDPRPVRVKIGRLGLLGIPGRAFVVADTVHVPLHGRSRPQLYPWREPLDPRSTPAPSVIERGPGHGEDEVGARHPLDLSLCAPALLVHELAHVWQHQRHGTRYLSECLLAQWLGDGYDVAAGLARGRGFAQLNFEQQAELLEQAWTAGWFAGEAMDAAGAAGEQLLLMRPLDSQRDDGLAATLTRDPHEVAERLAGGWRDATPALAEALAALPSADPP